ncbi:MAG: GNAT family N-acetyltransferase [Chloroflexi bacterium]|nr:GNAT family N-acetyltransferase [Chloroflexota bacterium]
METKVKEKGSDWLPRVTVRHIQAQDLYALEWEGEFTHFRRVYWEAYQRSRLGSAVLWVAELKPVGIIGQVFIQLVCDRPELANGSSHAYLYSFRVRPEYRNAGLGSYIMDVVEQDLFQRGFHYVTLNVAKDNPQAQRLYERRGYKVVAHEPGYWSYIDEKGRWQSVEEPAWRMEKRLER